MFRSKEEDWIATQAGYFAEVRELANQNRCPLVVAGDIFHQWNAPAEIINYAMGWFKAFGHGVYTIPGQHDLPNHRYEDIERSAYWTLCKSGVITNVNGPILRGSLRIFGYAWGDKVHDFDGWGKKKTKEILNLAVIHDYCWSKGHMFPGCPEDKHVDSHRERLKGYDAVVFGDNHLGFVDYGSDDMCIANCGGFMRRNSDQIDYKPFVVLLSEDDHMHKHYLNVADDQVWDDLTKEDISQAKSYHDFFRSIKNNTEIAIDFRETCKQWIMKNKVSPNLAKLIIECIEESES